MIFSTKVPNIFLLKCTKIVSESKLSAKPTLTTKSSHSSQILKRYRKWGPPALTLITEATAEGAITSTDA